MPMNICDGKNSYRSNFLPVIIDYIMKTFAKWAYYFTKPAFFLYCIVVLRPRKTSKVMSERSVNVITLFLGRLRQTLNYIDTL